MPLWKYINEFEFHTTARIFLFVCFILKTLITYFAATLKKIIRKKQNFEVDFKDNFSAILTTFAQLVPVTN